MKKTTLRKIATLRIIVKEPVTYALIAITWQFPKGTLGEIPMFVFSDTYGNDITVKLQRG